MNNYNPHPHPTLPHTVLWQEGTLSLQEASNGQTSVFYLMNDCGIPSGVYETLAFTRTQPTNPKKWAFRKIEAIARRRQSEANRGLALHQRMQAEANRFLALKDSLT